MYRIGNAIDIHNLKKQTNCYITLGALKILSDYKIESFSDGDIILHAIAEAIYGALGCGDLGDYFSDQDVTNKNLDSQIILNDALTKMKKMQYKIVNIDLVVISQHIYINKHKKQIKQKLSVLLQNDNINIKATRWETDIMQIHCHCSLLLQKVNEKQ